MNAFEDVLDRNVMCKVPCMLCPEVARLALLIDVATEETFPVDRILQVDKEFDRIIVRVEEIPTVFINLLTSEWVEFTISLLMRLSYWILDSSSDSGWGDGLNKRENKKVKLNESDSEIFDCTIHINSLKFKTSVLKILITYLWI